MGISEAVLHGPEGTPTNRRSPRRIPPPAIYAIYALAVSIAIWFIAIHAPLRLDETGSYWGIDGGLSQIWSRQYLGSPVYSYILWLSTKVLGASEVALRIPSVLAMLGAVWLLYLAAREIFSRDLAILAAVIFCLHPIVVFESIDIRPYSFAVLATNAAILILLRMRHDDSNWLAALFGFLAVAMLYFHFLFATILPAFVVCFFILKKGSGRAMWKQFGVAAGGFALAFPPLIPGIYFMFHTATRHVYEPPPLFGDLLWTLMPGLLPFVFCGVALLAALAASFKSAEPKDSRKQHQTWRIAICASLALVPLLILYGVSVATPIHTFAIRHRMDAIPGLALVWAWLIERYLRTQPLRLLFCVVLVAGTALQFFRSPDARLHDYTWKYSTEVAEKNAAPDNAPVLVCSSFVESNYIPMPLHSPKTSRYFAQLSYYKLTVPVVPLPRALNAQAIRIGSQFLTEATQKHQRFLAIGHFPSFPTLDWLSKQASPNYNVRDLGTYSQIKVLEFDPKLPATPPAAR